MIDQSAERRLLNIRDRAHSATRKHISAQVQAYLSGGPMVAQPTIPSSDVLDPLVERRRFGRKAVTSQALVRRVGGFNFEVALTDLSLGGCRVEMLEPCEIGDSAITRFPQLEPLGSRVCWTQGTATGMAFSTSIHPAVFDMLALRLSTNQA